MIIAFIRLVNLIFGINLKNLGGSQSSSVTITLSRTFEKPCTPLQITRVWKDAKTFICLRASRRTELERSGGLANHVLNGWFGHSGAVAETYYLPTTEADFDLAVKQLGGPLGGPSQGCQSSPREATKRKNPGESGVMMFPDGSGGAIEYTPEVFHSSQKTRQKSSNVAFGGLLGGPLTSQQSELIDLWH